jgi:DNA-binding response OmpR family regulator
VPYDDFLLKPFELGQLYERLRVLLDLELEFSETMGTQPVAGGDA